MYATPPFPPYGNAHDPNKKREQVPPQHWFEDTGRFKLEIKHPPLIQLGSTIRFYFKASDVTDGPISTFSTALAAVILDRYGYQAVSSYFTYGNVTADPSGSNLFYIDVQINPICEVNWFEIQWSGAYQPQDGTGPWPFQTQRGFRVFAPTSPSRHYLMATDQFGAH